MILQAFPIAPSPLTYYDNIAKYTHRKNVNSTIQELYQYSCWYGSFFIYPLRKKGGFPMLLFYLFIAIWVSVNGITSPFDDALSFFMWAAVLVPVIACVFILLHCGDDDRKN